jgi:hypothetical protein
MEVILLTGETGRMTLAGCMAAQLIANHIWPEEIPPQVAEVEARFAAPGYLQLSVIYTLADTSQRLLLRMEIFDRWELDESSISNRYEIHHVWTGEEDMRLEELKSIRPEVEVPEMALFPTLPVTGKVALVEDSHPGSFSYYVRTYGRGMEQRAGILGGQKLILEFPFDNLEGYARAYRRAQNAQAKSELDEDLRKDELT